MLSPTWGPRGALFLMGEVPPYLSLEMI